MHSPLSIRVLVPFAALLALAPLCAQPNADAPRPAPPVLQDGRFERAGRPVLLSWATHFTDVNELDAYTACGFNTVYLDLGASDESDNAAVGLADAAARRGLAIIVGLNAIDANGPAPLPLDAADARGRAVAWLAQKVQAWSHTPNLVAWALQNDVEDRIEYAWPDFAPWLTAVYPDPKALCASWGLTAIVDYRRLTPEMVAGIDFRRPGQLGAATLDVAEWRMSAVRELQESWINVIHGIDPTRPVLSGRMSRGRSLLAASDRLSGLQPEVLPPTATTRSADPAELTALAAQSGRFAPCLCLDAGAAPDVLFSDAVRAAGRGLAAMSFASWPSLRDDLARRGAATLALARLRDAGAAAFRPASGWAILLEPLLGGPALYGPRWYGYASMGGDEPEGLLAYLRRGTTYGPPDVLADRDLKRVPLERYGTIFLPAAFDLDADQIARLVAYVDNGGILVADYGLGGHNLGAGAHLPPVLADLFGVKISTVRLVMDAMPGTDVRDRVLHTPPGAVPFPGVPSTVPLPGALVFCEETPLLPAVRLGDGSGPGSAPGMLALPAAFCLAGPQTHVLAMQAQIPNANPVFSPIAGLFQRNEGSGTALFASTLLWESWRADDPLFDAVHDGLLRWRPAFRALRDTGGEPGPTWLARGRDGLWMHRAVDQPGEICVDVPSHLGALLDGGLNVMRRNADAQRTGGEPLIDRYLGDVSGGELSYRRYLPITVWPTIDSAAAQVVAYDRDHIEIQFAGPGRRAVKDMAGIWTVDAPVGTEAIVVLRDGPYRLAPGALHRAEWRRYITAELSPEDMGKPGSRHGPVPIGSYQKELRTVTVDPDGRLVFRSQFQTATLRLTPAEAPSP
jgi:hypothetical protein